jgi:hypothetical protein
LCFGRFKIWVKFCVLVAVSTEFGLGVKVSAYILFRVKVRVCLRFLLELGLDYGLALGLYLGLHYGSVWYRVRVSVTFWLVLDYGLG